MPNFLHTRLRTPPQRAVAVFILLLSIMLLFRLSAGSVWQARLTALIPTVVAIILLRRFWRRWRTARFAVMRWEIRMVRSWRAYARKPPVVEALHLLGIAIVSLAMVAMVCDWYRDLQISMAPALVVFAVAGVCEIIVQTKRMLKQAWAQVTGKILSLSFGVILTAATLSMAKQSVHSLAHIDPKYLTEFTTAVAAGLLPLVCLGVAGIVLILWATLQILLLGALLLGGSLLTPVKPFVGDRTQNGMRMFWYRIRTGKRPPGRVMPAAVFMPQHEVSLVGSALAKVAVVWALAQVGEGIAVIAPDTTPMLVKAMVKLEYRPNSSCRNLDPGLGIVYMDDGNVSVARREGDHYRFTVEKCEYASGT